MKLQVALDFESRKDAKRIIEGTRDYVDIYEIGTCFLMKEGASVVEEYRKLFPDITLLADAKIMDAGYEESQLLFEAGADIVTVLACTDTATLQNCIRCAREYGKQVMMDLIAIENITDVISKVQMQGLDFICAHRSVDKETANEEGSCADLSVLEQLKAMEIKAEIAVAGGIRKDNLNEIILEKPDVVIMGRSITSSQNIENETKIIRGMLDE